MNETIKKTTAYVSLGGVLSLGALFGLLDQRYASASDVEILVQSIENDRVERLEFAIASVARRISYLLSIDNRSARDEQQLASARYEKEYLIRTLKRLSGG